MKSWQEFLQAAAPFELSAEQLESLREFYGRVDGAFFDEMLSLMPGRLPEEEIARRCPQEEEQRKFLMLLSASSWECLVRHYRESGYPDSMLENIRRDLRLWADKTMSDWGYAGLNRRLFIWSRCVLSGRVLQFGRLQSDFPHEFAGEFSVLRDADGSLHELPGRETRPGALLNWHDPVINLHIPAAGPLRRELCIDSLRRIMDFSARFRPGYDFRAFVCYSWVLDPVWQEWNPESNLARYQKLGRLFPLGHDQTDEVVWRVWGAGVQQRGIASAQGGNSMQRFVADRIRAGKKFQEYGFYILREELDGLLAGA